ncbi:MULTISPECIES: hypothetical protein [unclassified Mycolicibacterium]|uniref:hypothetical protein n=1 Tax=unclassified Mycolicibacterium TaxID=2636767 RepID=UPI0012DFDDDE|nr:MULTISPECIES: hypothetical protein [unclassified Mycolicibacterium]MUL83326.1 hypothetical protein [Mycolicibacterium sp. CBMA 329]MUL90317.1 hypothetical protein [Mycolicibacterium sp. CBMA 331]MUM00291.1 hypothetical protein [Mycolicibacterium sp. CBMA 334]MUM26504.1 hypothetical protein [Mycolicibacterium sp. CBMA 295]MUM41261.1 hypothetical protein [Mycolicibacterium sp. CBMA 247]
MLRNVFDRQLSIRQLVHLAIVVIVGVGLPYLTIGVIWACNHSDHLRTMSGINQVFSVLGEIMAWPVLLVADINLV